MAKENVDQSTLFVALTIIQLLKDDSDPLFCMNAISVIFNHPLTLYYLFRHVVENNCLVDPNVSLITDSTSELYSESLTESSTTTPSTKSKKGKKEKKNFVSKAMQKSSKPLNFSTPNIAQERSGSFSCSSTPLSASKDSNASARFGM